jgi:hypothetical protein
MTMSQPTDNNGVPHPPQGDDLAAAWARLLRLQAARQGRPVPSDDVCDGLLLRLLGRPSEDGPTPRRRKRKGK